MSTPCRSLTLDATARWLLLIVGTLLGLGVIMVYSTQAPYLAREFGLAASWAPLWEQFYKVGVGFLFLLGGFLLRPAWLLKLHWVLIGVAILLLCLVLVPSIGAELNGARRWFIHGPLVFQPVEFAKVAVIVFIAARVEVLGSRIKSFLRGFVPAAAILGVLMLLLVRQPDLGSTVFVFGLGSLLLILGGARVAHFLLVTATALPFVAWYAFTRLDHVAVRISEFRQVTVGGQLWQSLVALGSGGLTGNDLGAGYAKLGYLPAISSDFILAGIGDEAGFLGTSLVVLLFLLFTLLATRIVLAQTRPALFLIGAGVTLSIAVQAVINIAVVTGAVPTKGIALPFVSAGGSSLALSLFSVGLLLRLARPEQDPGVVRVLGGRLRWLLGAEPAGDGSNG